MLAVLEQRFEQLGIEMSKIVSLASDGVSVMMGKTGGLAAKLQDKHCPMLLNIHCVCHKLVLACTLLRLEEWKQNCHNYGSTHIHSQMYFTVISFLDDHVTLVVNY